MLAKGLGDANAAAQDAALEALQSYLANSDEAQAAQCAPLSLHVCAVAAISYMCDVGPDCSACCPQDRRVSVRKHCSESTEAAGAHGGQGH
jgi:hypothetical protein